MNKKIIHKKFEEWYEADAMPLESNWFKRDPKYSDDYDNGTTQTAWEGWQAGLAEGMKRSKEWEKVAKQCAQAICMERDDMSGSDEFLYKAEMAYVKLRDECANNEKEEDKPKTQ